MAEELAALVVADVSGTRERNTKTRALLAEIGRRQSLVRKFLDHGTDDDVKNLFRALQPVVANVAERAKVRVGWEVIWVVGFIGWGFRNCEGFFYIKIKFIIPLCYMV